MSETNLIQDMKDLYNSLQDISRLSKDIFMIKNANYVANRVECVTLAKEINDISQKLKLKISKPFCGEKL